MLQAYYHTKWTEAGCDEAGRGCLAGPVFAAAVVLPKDFYHPLLNDSKQVPEEDRNELRTFIEQNALAFAVRSVDQVEIDRINILNASFKAMHLALDALTIRPRTILVDGNRFHKYQKIKHYCIIKGDSIYAPIAAASILAKTYRDAYMRALHDEFPHYCWDTNKGYGTVEHRNAIESHGQCIHHRKTFNWTSPQLELELEI